MVFGTPEDLRGWRGIIGKDDYREALEHAPPVSATRDPGRIGTWFVAADPRRLCRCGLSPIDPEQRPDCQPTLMKRR